MTFQSVTFGTDQRTVHDNDATTLNRGVQNPNAMSDSQKANVHIATRSGELHTFNSHSGNTQVAPATTTVQLNQPTGRVAILGTTVTPEVYEKMKETSPELFVEPEVKAAKQAEAVEAAADAAKEAAAVEELNRFVDPAAQAAALHVNSDVSLSDRTQLLWQLHSTGTVNGPTLQRVAEQMYMSVDEAAEALNAIHTNHSLQVATLCGSKGVDALGFASWCKTNRSTEMFRAVQVQANERDFVRAWSGLVDEFKARGQR